MRGVLGVGGVVVVGGGIILPFRVSMGCRRRTAYCVVFVKHSEQSSSRIDVVQTVKQGLHRDVLRPRFTYRTGHSGFVRSCLSKRVGQVCELHLTQNVRARQGLDP